LDKLLRQEDVSSTAPTPYTAAIPEYRVVFVKPEDAMHINKSFTLSNGHAVYDIQHPCRYESFFLLSYA
jgi:NADPH-ferrihemoprotein reductase